MKFYTILLSANIYLIIWLSTAKGEGKSCEFPQFKNGHLYYEESRRPYFPTQLGKQYSYYCVNGFVTPSKSYWNYLRCTTDGWQPKVPCLKQCVFHHVENGESSSWEKVYIQGQSVTVNCYPDYSLPNGQDTMTCTENGWSPPPKCFPMSMKKCSVSDIEIENGFFSESEFTYVLNRKTWYRCKQGYVTSTGETSGSITCLQNGWSPQPSCIKSCDMPVLKNAATKSNSTWFKLNDKLDYECHVGYETKYKHTKGSIMCTSYGWSDIPSCNMKLCEFPQFKNGHLYYEESRRPYFPAQLGKQYSYYCVNGFVTPSKSYWNYLRCTTDGWQPKVPCLKQCVFHHVENGESSSWEKVYIQGQSVTVNCYPDYSLPNGQDTMTCTENGWSPPPKCFPMSMKNCSLSDIEIENGFFSESEFTYVLNSKTWYRCKQGYVTSTGETSGSITCLQSGWSPQPSCINLTGICGPPPTIDNGDITSFPLPVYVPLSSVEYKCQFLYKVQGNLTITCKNGEWSEPPKCLSPCVLTEEIMRRKNVTLKGTENKKVYIQSGEYAEFQCITGYQKTQGSPELRTKCIDGHINRPTCSK